MSGYIDKRLLKMSRGGGKFIKLDVGDSFKGIYVSWKPEKDEKFDKIKPVFFFKDAKGNEKQLGTGAKKFGKRMAKVVPGSLVQITKLGEGQKTDFSVKVIKEAKMPQDLEEEDDVEEEDEEDDFVEAPKKKKKRKKKAEEDFDEDDDDDDDDESDLF